MFCPNTGTKFREPYHLNHVIPCLVTVTPVLKTTLTATTVEEICTFEPVTRDHLQIKTNYFELPKMVLMYSFELANNKGQYQTTYRISLYK